MALGVLNATMKGQVHSGRLRRRRFAVSRYSRLRIAAVALFSLGHTSAWADLVVGTKEGRVYHTQPECPSAKKIAVENRVTFKTASEAQAEGRRLCKTCEMLVAVAARPSDNNTGPTKPGQGQPPPATPKPTESELGRAVHVKRVLAGGTVELDTGDKLRIEGLCLPQVGQDQAEEAVSFIQERLRGSKVRVSPRVGDDNAPIRDDLGRITGRLYLDDQKPDLADQLVAAGLAWANRCDPGDVGYYLSLETEAWQKSRGIWKRFEGPAGRTEVLVGRYGLSYHPLGCPHAGHLTAISTITLNEAKARRLTPCDCYPAVVPISHTASKSNNAKEKHE